MREGRAQTVGRAARGAAGSKLWLIPLGCLLAGAALSFVTAAVDSACQVPDIQGIGSGADVAAAPGAVEEAAR